MRFLEYVNSRQRNPPESDPFSKCSPFSLSKTRQTGAPPFMYSAWGRSIVYLVTLTTNKSLSREGTVGPTKVRCAHCLATHAAASSPPCVSPGSSFPRSLSPVAPNSDGGGSDF